MFIYDTEERLCSKYFSSISEHEKSCRTIGGPTMPSINKCDRHTNPDCLVSDFIIQLGNTCFAGTS